MGVLDRQIYKKIEWYLYNYYEIRRYIAEKKEDIIDANSKDLTEWGSGISYHSDPTANKTMKLCKEDIVETEKWLQVIEATIKEFQGTEKGQLLQKKYFDELGEKHICMELNIERATYFNWRNEIVFYVALLAAQEGLIKINHIS